MTLAEHFFHTFPQLEGVGFSHRWGGAIDTCSRFSPFWGTAYDRRVAYVVGYTGLGVAATRFGANVMLDLLGNQRTQRTALKMVSQQAAAVPARTRPDRRGAAHPPLDRGRRCERRSAQPVAADPRPTRPRLRLLNDTNGGPVDHLDPRKAHP